jgi:hypothetical protein
VRIAAVGRLAESLGARLVSHDVAPLIVCPAAAEPLPSISWSCSARGQVDARVGFIDAVKTWAIMAQSSRPLAYRKETA